MGGKEPAEMTVAVLREELKRRGLDTTGVKAVLVERLRGAIDAEATGGDRPTTKQKTSDDLCLLVDAGLSVKDIERVWSGDPAIVRAECEKIVGHKRVSLQRQVPIGLELLQGTASSDDALVTKVAASLREELEYPPDRFKDSISLAIMNEPMMIETGYVFDRTTIFGEDGEFKFDNCPMTRKEIQPQAFPVVYLKKELIEYKLGRLDAVLKCARQASTMNSRRALLAVAKTLLDQLGSGTYIHRAERYWTLRMDSIEPGPEMVKVVGALAAEESVGKLDAS